MVSRALSIGCIYYSSSAWSDILPSAIGDKNYIMFDSGVRGASDVFEALAIGAKFVFVDRLWVWLFSVMGDHGVRHVMKSLLADFDTSPSTSLGSRTLSR